MVILQMSVGMLVGGVGGVVGVWASLDWTIPFDVACGSWLRMPTLMGICLGDRRLW